MYLLAVIIDNQVSLKANCHTANRNVFIHQLIKQRESNGYSHSPTPKKSRDQLHIGHFRYKAAFLFFLPLFVCNCLVTYYAPPAATTYTTENDISPENCFANAEIFSILIECVRKSCYNSGDKRGVIL